MDAQGRNHNAGGFSAALQLSERRTKEERTDSHSRQANKPSKRTVLSTSINLCLGKQEQEKRMSSPIDRNDVGKALIQ